jgi:hypothetical protein
MINNSGKISYQLDDFNLYRTDGSQDGVSCFSGGQYRFGNIPLGLTMIIDTSLLKTTYNNKEHNIESLDSISTKKTNFVFQSDLIQTTYFDGVGSAQEGIYLDFNARQYIFGVDNAKITCEASLSKIIFNTKFLQLDAIILNSSSTTISVNTIPITINSTQYYILLAT